MSAIQTSLPTILLVAAANTLDLYSKNNVGSELPGPGSISDIILASIVELLIVHTSFRLTPLLAAKRMLLPILVNAVGLLPLSPGQISFTKTVPVGVPLLLQSSRPVVPSSEEK